MRERELRDAEHRARIAELDTRILAVADLERQVVARLASLKDGAPGLDGKDGVDGTDGRDGASITVEDIAPLIQSEAERVAVETAKDILSTWDRPQDGRSITPEEMVPLVDECVQRAVAALPVPKDGIDGNDGRDGIDGADGRDGADGTLPVVKEWADGVHYAGNVVAFRGSTYQAIRDTGREPGASDDWICIAQGGMDGKDGRSFTIRGTWSEEEDYWPLDVVALGGASFAARHDNPGPCPGEGWQLIAAQGKRGNQGDRGLPGSKGDRGDSGLPTVSADVDHDGLLTLTNGDGSEVRCDLYPLLSKLER